MKNEVYFKGTKDGIIVLLNEDLTFDEIKESLTEKSREAKNFFGGTKTNLVFKGREISSDEISELTNIVVNEGGLNISFVSDEIYIEKYLKKNTEKNEVTEKLDNLKTKIEEKKAMKSMIGENTLLHKGSLRSGSLIKHSGSVIVLGNINQGAEILATGNVIILGHAKGLIHAGCSGDDESIVFALDLDPIQLRIGSIITYIPKNEKRNKIPSYAYVDDGTIYIKKM